MAKYGQITWEDGSSGSSRPRYDNEKFFKLEKGANTVRSLMEQPYMYLYHKVKFNGDQSPWGRNIRCANDGCPLCEKDQPKPKYILAVKVEGEDEPKYFEFGPLVFNSIQNIRKQMKICENILEYDLNILFNPKGSKTTMYQVIPGQKTTLSADDISMAENVDKDWLDKYCEPVTVKEQEDSITSISKWLEKKAKEADGDAKPVKRQAMAKPEPKEEEETSEIDENAFNFKVVKKS